MNNKIYTWVCSICNKQFSSRRKLQEHRKIDHNCQHKFPASTHNKIHWICSFCNKESYTQSSAKTLHEKYCKANPNALKWIGHKVSEETKRKISELKKGQIPWNKGIPLSEETKKKIGNVNKGKIYVNDGVHNKLIIPDQLDEYLLNGYYKGRTQETIDKIAKVNTGKKRSPESVENIIKGTLLAKQRKKEMNV